jgi:HPr kinase/phosphorylase
VRLELWKPEGAYDRIGLEDHFREVLGIPIREVCLPVQPGRNMSSIIEIAARNELLRQAGHHPARDLVRQIEAGLLKTDPSGSRIQRPPSHQFRAVRVNESAAPPPVVSPKRVK